MQRRDLSELLELIRIKNDVLIRQFISHSPFRVLDEVIHGGHVEIARYLLTHTDVLGDEGQRDGVYLHGHGHPVPFLAYAALNGQTEIMDLLFELNPVDMVTTALYQTSTSYGYGEQQYCANISDALAACQTELAETYPDQRRAALVADVLAHEAFPMIHDIYKKALAEFDRNKSIVIDKIARLQREVFEYRHVISLMMDRAIGQDFPDDGERCKFGFSFLKELKSVAGINFLGVSLGGKPVTRDMLTKLGFTDVDAAIVTMNDLYGIDDVVRRDKLTTCLQAASKHLGADVRGDGTLNALPLAIVAQNDDPAAVQGVRNRLAAGVNPNTCYGGSCRKPLIPMIEAASHGCSHVVEVLMNDPDIDLKILPQAAQFAQAGQHFLLADMINMQHDKLQREMQTKLGRKPFTDRMFVIGGKKSKDVEDKVNAVAVRRSR